MVTEPASLNSAGNETDGRLLSILMPIYNERGTLSTIIRRVLAVEMPLPFELIAVDDGSRDGSDRILQELAATDARIKPYFHKKNQGKGAAILTAIQNMTGDIAIVQDADLEYDPQEIPRVIEPILDGKADAVFGTRFAGSQCHRVLYYWHTMINAFLTWLTNVVCDLNWTDVHTCYKAVRADILRQTALRSQDFSFDQELTIRLAQWGIRLYEVPISYAARTYSEGKKISWKDGLHALAVIFLTTCVYRKFTTREGYYTLRAVNSARGWNLWMHSRIARYVGKRVFEAGCGIGTLSQLLLQQCERLVCADTDPFYVELIDRRFGHIDHFRSARMDLACSEDYSQFNNERIDTVVCVNVLERLEDDEGALKRFFEMLVPGGRIIVLASQHRWLYAPRDAESGHLRRYTASELRTKLSQAGFEIVDEEDFNRLGTLGWFMSGKVMRRKDLSSTQVAAFNLLLPLARFAELLPIIPGLSRIVVARKPA